MTIKNIIFDVGNVLLRWDPYFIVTNAFPERADHQELVQHIFRANTWAMLNLGKVTEEEAVHDYHQRLHIEKARLQQMMTIVKESLVPIEGSLELLTALHQANFQLFALTDNTLGIMAHLEKKYDFWPVFEGVVVSAKIGFLKPAQEIYYHLLNTYQIQAAETVFIDDHEPNIIGAKMVGLNAIQFKNTQQCIDELRDLGVVMKGLI